MSNNMENKRSIKDDIIFILKKRGVVLGAVLALIVGCLLYAPSIVQTNTRVGNRELPIYCVDTTEKKVALSFDAAWGNEDTGQLLEILAKHDVKVTFFMTGEWMKKYPDDVKRIYEAGHDIANHGENHKNMSQLNTSDIQSELLKPHQTIKELLGIEMCLFRPPYGDYDNDVITTATACKYYTVQWSVDSLDWKDYGAESIVKTVLNHKNLGNGAIILMHNGAKYTKDALEQIIVGLQTQGYKLVPISQLIHTGEFHMDHTGKQFAD